MDGASRRSRESYGSFFIWFDNRQVVGLVLGYWWQSPVCPRLVRLKVMEIVVEDSGSNGGNDFRGQQYTWWWGVGWSAWLDTGLLACKLDRWSACF